MADKSKELFSASNRDKIREAHAKGKRTVVVADTKLTMSTDKKHNTIIVRKATGEQMPLMVLDTNKKFLAQQKARSEAIAQHHKDVKSGEKVLPKFDMRRKKKK